jgi:Protein of unknown function (DUF1329)
MKKRLLVTAMMLAGAFAGFAHAATEADVEASFNPYKNGFPSFAGLTPGTVINKDNVDKFRAVLDSGLYTTIKNGWYEIKVAPTTQFELHRGYIEATKKNLNKTKLGAKNGQIEGFVGGRPFPEEPQVSDPRSGEKVAWNYKYGLNWGDNATIAPFWWKYRNMNTSQIERTLKFNFSFLNFKHRTTQAPMPEVTPNSADLYRGFYVRVLEPQDLKNTQLLIQRYDDDLKFDDAYLYLGFQRRVRRLATGQVNDSFLGSDLMIEDFEGYNGRVSDMKWKFLGTKNILMPYYNHNEQKLTDEFKETDGYKYIDYHGKGGCYPNVTWQLRKVYELEAVPVAQGHPISKRIFYIDAQLYNISRTMIYDRKGELWKDFTIGKSHPDHHLPINKGSGIGIDDAFSMVDMQTKHCTTGQFKGQIDIKNSHPSLFQVQNLRGGD